MNERINELMEQAGLYNFVIESMGIDEEMKKFAELIVRECAVVCRRYGESGDGYTCSNDIKEHFGVE